MTRNVLALLVLLLLAGPVCAESPRAELWAGFFVPPRLGPVFSLRGSDGSELKLSRYRGKVVALAFGYTNCPSVCPVTLGYLAEARKKLGAGAKDLQVVFVTVDPERDDPPHLKKFVAFFDPTFVAGTGTPGQLAEIRKVYGITMSDKIFTDAASKSKGIYYLDHSSFVYLIDREGKLRAMMPFGVTADDIEHDAKALLSK
jgi:protein SCO1/2